MAILVLVLIRKTWLIYGKNLLSRGNSDKEKNRRVLLRKPFISKEFEAKYQTVAGETA